MSTTEAPRADAGRTAGGGLPRTSAERTAEVRKVLIALLVSAGVCIVLWQRTPKDLTVKTDVIGNPIYADFNIERYFSEFHIVAYWLPAIALAVYAALTLLARWRARRPLRAVSVALAQPIVPPPPGIAGRVARTLMVGAVFGLELAIWQGGEHPVLILAGVAVGWSIAIHAAAWAWAKAGHQRSTALGAAVLNAVTVPFGVLGLLLVSSVSAITTLDDGRRHPTPWLPWWVAFGVTAVALALVLRPLLAARDRRSPLTVERRAIVFLSIPLAIYITVISIPHALPGQSWVFEEGHWLVGQQLISHGFFPWRDFLTDHGLFEDSLRALLGTAAFGDTRWATVLGDVLVWYPAFLLGLYYLTAYITESRSMAFLVAVAALLCAGTPLIALHVRFLLWAYIVLLLLATLRKRTRWRPALLGLLITGQAVLVPESAYCAIAVFVALVGYEATHREGRTLLAAFSNTIWYAASAVALALVFLVILASQHALGSFVNYYVIFLDGHELAGGIPHLEWTPWVVFWAATPIAGWLATVAFIAYKVRQGRRPDAFDWTLVATAILSVLYYGKFLARADLHLLQSFGVCAPMFIMLVYLLADRIDLAALRIPRAPRLAALVGGRAASALVAVIAVAILGQTLVDTVGGAPQRFRPVAATEPTLPQLGYASADALDPALYHDLKVVTDTYVGPGGRIEDFSNQPGIFHFALGLVPATRYYHIALAIPEAAQEDVVKQLAANPPNLVVINDGRYGLPAWDLIANQVRHHTVAQWIYDHYKPLMSIDTEVLFVLASASLPPPSAIAAQLSQPPVTDGLWFATQVCDWGYIPDHLTVVPSNDEQAAAATLWSGEGLAPAPVQLSPPPGKTWSDYRWLEVDTRSGFADDTFVLHQAPHADGAHVIVFGTTFSSPHRYFVHVGACGQWHGYAPDALTLTHDSQAAVTAIRLLP
jgi:hypothetical protein